MIFLIAGLVRLLGAAPVAKVLSRVELIALALLVFDLVTVKFRLRPPEPLPKSNDDLDLFDLMRARRSYRSFQTRKLIPADHAELMESVRRDSAEKTLGKFLVRFKYIAAPLTIWPRINVSEFLVAIAPKQ